MIFYYIYSKGNNNLLFLWIMEISVIIPVYNRAHIVQRTLESVKSQTYRPVHLILVDNGSTDSSIDILNLFAKNNNSDDFKVTVSTESTPGACAARNKGLSLTDTEWVLFFDSDDVMGSTLLADYAAKIQENSENLDIVMCRGDVLECDGSIREQPYYKCNLLCNQILHSLLNPQRFIARKSIIMNCGAWNESLYGWNDWELGIRILCREPKVAFIDYKISVHVYAQVESITGIDYASKSHIFETSVDAACETIRNSNLPDKKRLLQLVEYKRLCLAALYTKEGSEKGKALYDKIMHSEPRSIVKCIFFPLLYRYVASGKHGGAQVMKRLVGYF